MLRIEKRKNSGIWRIRGTLHGKSVDQSARTRSEAEAKRIKDAIEREIFAEVYGFKDKKPEHTFADAAVAWLEAGGDVTPFPYFEAALSAMGSLLLADITQGTIDKKALAVMPTQAPATRKRHFYTPVSIILGFAADERMMNYMRIKRPSVKVTRPDIFTPSEFETLLSASGDFAPLLTFFLGTGGRTGEVMRVDHNDFSPSRGRVVFWRTKADKVRSVDMCERTREALPERGTGRLWPRYTESSNGRFYGPATRMGRICTRLGWKPYGPHTLRHTWASWQYAIKPDTLRLMQKGGWSDQKMVENYVHLGTPDLGKEVLAHGWFK